MLADFFLEQTLYIRMHWNARRSFKKNSQWFSDDHLKLGSCCNLCSVSSWSACFPWTAVNVATWSSVLSLKHWVSSFRACPLEQPSHCQSANESELIRTNDHISNSSNGNLCVQHQISPWLHNICNFAPNSAHFLTPAWQSVKSNSTSAICNLHHSRTTSLHEASIILFVREEWPLLCNKSARAPKAIWTNPNFDTKKRVPTHATTCKNHNIRGWLAKSGFHNAPGRA